MFTIYNVPKVWYKQSEVGRAVSINYNSLKKCTSCHRDMFNPMEGLKHCSYFRLSKEVMIKFYEGQVLI